LEQKFLFQHNSEFTFKQYFEIPGMFILNSGMVPAMNVVFCEVCYRSAWLKGSLYPRQ